MSRSLISVAAALAALGVNPVHAEQAPRSAGYDPHVQVVAYNPLNVVRVVCSPRTSTQIIFAAAEKIAQVAIGDADGWLAQPTENLLFIKPTAGRAATNMQVVTRTPGGASRSYQFRLVAVRRARSTALYAVSFTYPADEAAAREAARTQAEAAAREKTAEARLKSAWAEGPRNWRYVAQGSNMIEPTEVSDNGRQTAFRFPGNMRVPTIYTAAPDGSEAIVPYTMTDDMVIVQTTARIFTLRDGQKVLRVLNQGFDPVGRNPGTGTGTPDLMRTVRSPGQ
jgi:type IV secretion system protein VirB9